MQVQEHTPQAASHGSSFYLAMRILERKQRDAMFAIYSFCRDIDDIADGDAPRPERLAQLRQWRDDIDGLYRGEVKPRTAHLAGPVERFGLDRKDFHGLLDGMEMDARGDIRAPALNELELYCDRVACAVGRLSVRVFGMEHEPGEQLAHHLGQALQLVNVLRDLDEDAAMGRLYLPREALALAGVAHDDPATALAAPHLAAACTFVADIARRHFAVADRILAAAPRRVVRAPRIMRDVYGQLLAQLCARGWIAPRRAVRLNKPKLIWTALRHVFV
jgi:presqualene diphosphate synthase